MVAVETTNLSPLFSLHVTSAGSSDPSNSDFLLSLNSPLGQQSGPTQACLGKTRYHHGTYFSYKQHVSL